MKVAVQGAELQLSQHPIWPFPSLPLVPVMLCAPSVMVQEPQCLDKLKSRNVSLSSGQSPQVSDVLTSLKAHSLAVCRSHVPWLRRVLGWHKLLVKPLQQLQPLAAVAWPPLCARCQEPSPPPGM